MQLRRIRKKKGETRRLDKANVAGGKEGLGLAPHLQKKPNMGVGGGGGTSKKMSRKRNRSGGP